MPIEAPKYRFSAAMVLGSPEEPGVYALWRDEEVLFIGRAAQTASIRDCLTLHLAGSCACTRRATHYSWELSLLPAAREAALLRAFQERFGRLPRCNAEAA